MSADNPDVTQPREIRVFISSTFRDMQSERDVLMKFVFPELRKLCAERGVSFVEVDLRWGISEEQAQRGEVLPICLAEIDRCRPFFIGLLAERYGWVPEELPPETVAEKPWLREQQGRSVTELEVIHGVLGKPAMGNRACFFFRDPRYIETLPPEQQDAYRETAAGDEIARFGRDESERRAAERRSNLAALKDRIRAEHRQNRLALREGYSDPKTLGDWVREHLTTVINQQLPPESKPNPLQREAALHDAFARTRAGVYIGRGEYFQYLDDYVASDPQGRGLVVRGESGMGKSALLANWISRCRDAKVRDEVLYHFVGASADSTDWTTMVRRLLGELKARFEIDDEIPRRPDQLGAAVVRFLELCSEQAGTEDRRVVLIVDALNQLADQAGRELDWLPSRLPQNVRMIVSTLPGRAQQDLESRGWSCLTVEPLSVAERRQLVGEYLQQYTKTLDEPRVRRITQCPQASNPLYLRALLDELRLFGVHERLDERIDHYLSGGTVAELYQLILGRWEQDYEGDRPGLVRDATSLIWGSRRGLREKELLDLLGEGGVAMPQVCWSPLSLALDSSLVSRSGLLTFFHDYLRDAVRDRYLDTEQKQSAVHLRLAEYFENKDDEERSLEEFPWQLARAKEWTRLRDFLCDDELEVLYRFHSADSRHELAQYWREMEGVYDLTDEYKKVLDEYESPGGTQLGRANRLSELTRFLKEYGRTDDVLLFARLALEANEAHWGADHPRLSIDLSYYAESLVKAGHQQQAEQAYRRAVRIAEQAENDPWNGLLPSVTNLAGFLTTCGRYQEAEPLLRRAVTLAENDRQPSLWLALSCRWLGTALAAMKQTDEAESWLRRAVSTVEAAWGTRHQELIGFLFDLSKLLMNQGQFPEADQLARRCLAIAEDSPNVDARTLSRLRQHQLMTNTGVESLDGMDAKQQTAAQSAFAQVFQALSAALKDRPDTKERGSPRGLRIQAHRLQKQGKLDDAENTLRDCLAKLSQQSDSDDRQLGETHLDLAQLLFYGKQDYAAARGEYSKAIEYLQSAGERGQAAIAMNNQAATLAAEERWDEALELFARSAEIQAELGNAKMEANARVNWAGCLVELGRPDEAEPLLRSGTAVLADAAMWQESKARYGLARILAGRGNYEDALREQTRAVEVGQHKDNRDGRRHRDYLDELRKLQKGDRA